MDYLTTASDWLLKMRDVPLDRSNIFHRDAAHDLEEAEKVYARMQELALHTDHARLSGAFISLTDLREKFERHTCTSIA